MQPGATDRQQDHYVTAQQWQKSISTSLFLAGFALLAAVAMAYFAVTTKPANSSHGPWYEGFAFAQIVFVTLPMVAAILCFTKQPTHLNIAEDRLRVTARTGLSTVMIFCSIASATAVFSLSDQQPTFSETFIVTLQICGLIALFFWWTLSRYGQELGSAYSDTCEQMFRHSSTLFIAAGACGVFGWLIALLALAINNPTIGDYVLLAQVMSYALAGIAFLVFWVAVKTLHSCLQHDSW